MIFIEVSMKEVIMERSNKKFIWITLLLCILLLTGCNKVHFNTFDGSEKEDQTTEADITQIPEDSAKKVDQDAEEDTTDQEVTSDEIMADTLAITPTQLEPAANLELNIYSINDDTGEIEPVTALIPEDNEITPTLIVDQVVDSMADKSLNVGIEKVSTEGDSVIVSFYGDQPPLSNVGAGIEAAILDAIAQSLIDNLKDYNKVIFRKEGKAYISGHIELDLNEVYLGAN
ncbi:MAG: hypothetical protein K0S47_1752 [Herbinix sp.]|jgi:hypothetical protein|nr:hypothetical protein [Herbinix sp.]